MLLGTIENKNRKILLAVIGVVAMCFELSLVQFADAAPKLPGSLSKDSIQGWCIEHGGAFGEYGDGSGYYCLLPDGTFVSCDKLGGNATACSTFNAAKVRGIKSALGIVELGSINIQQNQQEILTKLNSLSSQLSSVATEQSAISNQLVDVQQLCSLSDLVPLARPLLTGPQPIIRDPADVCQRDAEGKLIFRVHNQGGVVAAASTTRVFFGCADPSKCTGPTQVDLPTPELLGFTGVEMPAVSIPDGCFSPVTLKCEFKIGVDVGEVVTEANETNNTVSGACGPTIL